MSDLAFQTTIKESGEVETHLELSQEDKETLISLYRSRAWQLYRSVLTAQRVGYNYKLMSLEDPNKMAKTVGIVFGLEQAIKTLQVIVQTAEAAKLKEKGKEN